MTPAQQQNAYRAKCTHFRDGAIVYDMNSGSVVFNGNTKTPDGVLGINAAKRYVTKNVFAKCFTVK